MTYSVFSGTLNPTQSINRLLYLDYCWSVTIGFEAITAVTVTELYLVTVSNLLLVHS